MDYWVPRTGRRLAPGQFERNEWLAISGIPQYSPEMRKLMDPFWRRSRIAARILLRARAGKVGPRDRRWAQTLAADPSITDRLLDQAVASLTAKNHRHVPP